MKDHSPPPPVQPSPQSATAQDQHHQQIHQGLEDQQLQHPLSLLQEKKHHYLDKEPAKNHKAKERHDFVAKYGELDQVIGKGAFGTVRLTSRRDSSGREPLYAVKEFKAVHGESQKSYMRRVTSEFCIASALKHPNVIQTLDLLQIHDDLYCEVMDYCGGGDLHSLIASANTLAEPESNCFFYQLMHGVGFLHANGVVHRDLKPENLLLTADGCLKIADFGNSEVFRMPWERKLRESTSVRGSGPFIAPEEFTEELFDARKVDIWACGIVYLCMRLGRYTWHEASTGDPIWESFLYNRTRLLEKEAARRERASSLSATTPSPSQASPQPPPPGPARSVSSMASFTAAGKGSDQALHLQLPTLLPSSMSLSSPSSPLPSPSPSSSSTLASPSGSRPGQSSPSKSRPLPSKGQGLSGSKLNVMAIEQASHLSLGLPMHIAVVINDMLEPEPKKRVKAGAVLESDWMKVIECCHPSEATPDVCVDP